MIRSGRGAAVTPCSGQVLQARFSRLVTCDEIPRRLDIQHFADFVADHRGVARRSCRIRTAPACRQSPAPRGEDRRAESDVRDACASSCSRTGGGALRSLSAATSSLADPGLLFQQLQLQTTQLLAARSILFDPLQTKTLFENLDLQPRILQLLAGLRSQLAVFSCAMISAMKGFRVRREEWAQKACSRCLLNNRFPCG